MLEMIERVSTLFPKFSRRDTLTFSEPHPWSPEAKNHFRNASTISAKVLEIDFVTCHFDSKGSCVVIAELKTPQVEVGLEPLEYRIRFVALELVGSVVVL
jgi:hypothetical protein